MCGAYKLCSMVSSMPTVAKFSCSGRDSFSMTCFLQVRWATVLYRMMARMKSKVSISVAWRPLYQCVRDAYMEPLNTYTGMHDLTQRTLTLDLASAKLTVCCWSITMHYALCQCSYSRTHLATPRFCKQSPSPLPQSHSASCVKCVHAVCVLLTSPLTHHCSRAPCRSIYGRTTTRNCS